MTSIRAARLVPIVLALAVVTGCEAAPPASPPASSAGATQPSPAASSSPVAMATPSPSDAPTPTPSAVPSPTPSPSTGTAAQAYASRGEIADVLFAPDGRLVAVEQDWAQDRSSIVALDAQGRVLPGWPWSQGDTGNPIATAKLGPEGSVYVAVRSVDSDQVHYHWTLHRLGQDAAELAGFPQPLTDTSHCDLSVAPDGVVYATCEDQDADTGSTTTEIRAVRPDGTTVDGWPLTFRRSAWVAGFRPDGDVVVVKGGPKGAITVLRPDTTVVAGWPRRLADGANPTVDADGRVRVTTPTYEEDQCGAAIRTTYTLLRTDGRTVKGWPVTVRGWSSQPLVGSDGSMTIVTGTGHAIRYGRNGSVMGGWPVTGVDTVVGCYGGSDPVDAGAGQAAVSADKVTLITAAGRIATGWPVRLPGSLAYDCPDCTPGPGSTLAPAIGGDAIYVAAYNKDRPRLVTIARDGSGVARVAIGKKGDTITWVRIAPDGRVWMLLSRWSDPDQATTGILVPVAEGTPFGG